MSHERRVDVVRAQQRLFEWQNRRRLRHGLGEAREPVGAPRPHLRRDVVQHRHSGRGRRVGDLHVERRVVDQNDERHVAALDSALEVSQQRPMPRHVLEHLDEPHHRELLDVLDELHAGGAHLVAADADGVEASGRAARRELAHHARRVQIAGNFSGDEQNLTHERLPRRPARRSPSPAAAGRQDGRPLARCRGRSKARRRAPRGRRRP